MTDKSTGRGGTDCGRVGHSGAAVRPAGGWLFGGGGGGGCDGGGARGRKRRLRRVPVPRRSATSDRWTKLPRVVAHARRVRLLWYADDVFSQTPCVLYIMYSAKKTAGRGEWHRYCYYLFFSIVTTRLALFMKLPSTALHRVGFTIKSLIVRNQIKTRTITHF